jgi:hypothetical protein
LVVFAMLLFLYRLMDGCFYCPVWVNSRCAASSTTCNGAALAGEAGNEADKEMLAGGSAADASAFCLSLL